MFQFDDALAAFATTAKICGLAKSRMKELLDAIPYTSSVYCDEAGSGLYGESPLSKFNNMSQLRFVLSSGVPALSSTLSSSYSDDEEEFELRLDVAVSSDDDWKAFVEAEKLRIDDLRKAKLYREAAVRRTECSSRIERLQAELAAVQAELNTVTNN